MLSLLSIVSILILTKTDNHCNNKRGDTITTTRIIFGLFDLTAKKDANYQPFTLQPFSNLNNFKNNLGLSRKVATLEENQIITDGGFSVFPDNNTGFGLWSKELSDENGMFKTPIVLRIRFSDTPHSSIGLTLNFDDILADLAGETEIRWYDENDILIDFKKFIPDKTPYFFNYSVKEYKRIDFIFLGTNKPYRYLKLNGIEFGTVMTKEADDIISATLNESVSMIAAQLEINTLNCEFVSSDTDFSMFSAKGIYGYLQERQKLEVMTLRDDEEIPMGTYYVDSWDDGTTQSVKLSAVDALGVIDKTDFAGGIYFNITAQSLIGLIMTSANMEYTLSTELSAKIINGHIPICSHREALQLVCMAIGAFVDTTRDGVIKINAVPIETDFYIPSDRKFLGQKPSVNPLTTGIEVTAHNYVKRSEISEILKQDFEPGIHTIAFNEPTHSISVLGATLKKATVNSLTFEVGGEYIVEVTITGGVYEDIKEVIYKELDKIPTNSKPEVKRIESCTLIDKTNAKDVAERVLDYYKNRHQISTKILTEYEKVGKLAIVETFGESSLRGYIEKMKINLTGGYLSNIVVIGSPVPQFYGYYTTEIYTGEDVGII